MAKQQTIHLLRSRLVRVCQIHFFVALLFAVQIMLYDAWKLITPEDVLKRWALAAVLLIVTTLVWYMARDESADERMYRRLTFALVTLDIAIAALLVYMTRGMASRAVMLFAVPILTSGILLSRRALYATAFFSIAAYTTSAVAYFVWNFNEGYKIELYGEVSFYSAVMVILAGLTWAVVNPNSRD